MTCADVPLVPLPPILRRSVTQGGGQRPPVPCKVGAGGSQLHAHSAVQYAASHTASGRRVAFQPHVPPKCAPRQSAKQPRTNDIGWGLNLSHLVNHAHVPVYQPLPGAYAKGLVNGFATKRSTDDTREWFVRFPAMQRSTVHAGRCLPPSRSSSVSK